MTKGKNVGSETQTQKWHSVNSGERLTRLFPKSILQNKHCIHHMKWVISGIHVDWKASKTEMWEQKLRSHLQALLPPGCCHLRQPACSRTLDATVFPDSMNWNIALYPAMPLAVHSSSLPRSCPILVSSNIIRGFRLKLRRSCTKRGHSSSF